MSVPGVGASASGSPLSGAVSGQLDRLSNCVHCGFCLPVCPTYRRLGDEADSPRGRLYLMRAVTEERIEPSSEAFRVHIDRCLGCRACEPVCPSGVEYGLLLEAARHTITETRKQDLLTRMLLAVMASPWLRRAFFFFGRGLRDLGLAGLGATALPGRYFAKARLALAMLAASRPWARLARVEGGTAGASTPGAGDRDGASRGRVGVLTGCVQDGLYARINRATARTLEANGYEVVQVPGQGCCGALHAHGGSLDEARRLAGANVEAFGAADLDYIAVNAAGCGAAMKEYGVLLEGDPTYRDEGKTIAARVRDVSELLAAAGPVKGGDVSCTVAYDHPCHLVHAQGVKEEPLRVLEAIPGLSVRMVADAEECCGGAGIYGMTHPELGGRIGGDKGRAVAEAGADVACTANPGCMMQIGATLRLEGAPSGVVHPVELLDESYRRAGYYR